MSWDERGQALRAAAKGEFFSRTASLARLLEATPRRSTMTSCAPAARATRASGCHREEPASDLAAWQQEARAQLAQPLPSLSPPHHRRGRLPRRAVRRSRWRASRRSPRRRPALDERLPLGLAAVAAGQVPLSRRGTTAWASRSGSNGGAWLNAAFAKALPNALWTSQSAMSLGAYGRRAVGDRRPRRARHRPPDAAPCRGGGGAGPRRDRSRRCPNAGRTTSARPPKRSTACRSACSAS